MCVYIYMCRKYQYVYLYIERERKREREMGSIFFDKYTYKVQCIFATYVYIYICILKAGGEGLNLQAADHIFIMDPWRIPAAELQAIMRAHKIGQQRPVSAVRLVASGTIEDKVESSDLTYLRKLRRHVPMHVPMLGRKQSSPRWALGLEVGPGIS